MSCIISTKTPLVVRYLAPQTGQYHLWHILPGDGNGQYKNCSKDGLEEGAEGKGGAPFSQNLWVHTADSPSGPWRNGTKIIIADFKPGSTAQQR